MGFIKDKNLIKYTGRNYEITYNFTDGTLTTNHPNKEEYIGQTVSRCGRVNSFAEMISLAFAYNKYCRQPLNPFIETILLQAPKTFAVIANASYTHINDYIDMAKQNWKYVLQVEADGREFYDVKNWCLAINTIKFNLNELELKWLEIYQNIDFVRQFAGQLEMYDGLLCDCYIDDLIKWYTNNKIDIKPFLKNKNLLHTLKDLKLNKDMLYETKITDGITEMYEKYKYLEQTDADGWTYRLLKSREDFRKEATEMNNCLWTMEYDAKMSAGQCVIVVATTADGIKIDIELQPVADRVMLIRQAYYGNDWGLEKKDKEHLKKWVDGINCLMG